ncbi:hypothetical protein CVT24_009038 [Panaeolus cyanescens]|uniref:RRM domain-containing protein n=1 Tax=Panaeolus cyanescens TaxID=181874 RepID=A0A409YAK4_9AGAR|nr:hypothetical protein CVT24_009038 [Panaeolus cyanescens]
MPQKIFSNPRLWPSRSDIPHAVSNIHHRPILPPQNQHQDRVMLGPDTTLQPRQREDRLPHDASVFVGSLPSNVDQNDLTRMLMDHLSEHTEIKNIKVVRDSKGGVCAFVQCENAASATRLIQTLHSTAPKPFLGRTLRYEPARAFRTLLVSYRVPTQSVRHPPFEKTPVEVHVVEMEWELPHAIRICRQKNSRFHSISYNVEAIEAEKACNSQGSAIPSNDHVLFMNPLKFNEEALEKMASYFGKLESFLSLRDSNAGGNITIIFVVTAGAQSLFLEQVGPEHIQMNFPVPHNAPRSPNMDPLCWEIKWEHRDDCVSALMTLRRIPHLTVTWAHQPSIAAVPAFAHRHNLHVGFPLHAAGRLPQHLIHGALQDSSKSIHATPFPRQRNSPSAPVDQTRPECADAESAASLTETPRLDETEVTRQQTQTPISDSPMSTSNSMLLRTADANPALGTNSIDTFHQGDTQDLLYMPDTPSLDISSVTPITPGSQYPITPKTLASSDSPQGDFHQSGDVFTEHCEPQHHEKITDPTTLFVGGLELFGPGAWNEEKLTSFFSRFGGLESVKVVRPINSCAGFAFVKFDNVEGPARAVSEEHNRVYEGRTMRVQLRECNPTRNNWRPSRGRGRLFHNPIPFQRRFLRHGLERPIPNKGNDEAVFVTNDFGSNHLSLPSLTSLPETGTLSGPQTLDVHGVAATSFSPTLPPAEVSQTETYREWYDELDSPTHTPAPSSLGSSASATGVPLSNPAYHAAYPNAPFYPPVPWAHPSMLPGGYQVPYFGPYPPPYNPHPTHGQRLITPPASEASGPSSSRPTWPHSGIYPQPYMTYPIFPFRQTTEPTALLHGNQQAPLIPTGFMQNEQGTLIAVYQPEALDQYLTAAAAGSSPPVPHLINAPRFGAPPTLPVHHAVYDANNQSSATTTEPQASTQHRARSHAMFPFTSAPQPLNYRRSSNPLRGYDGTGHNPAPVPLYRRQGAKLDFTPSQQQSHWNGTMPSLQQPRSHGPGGNTHYPGPSP